MIFFKKFEALLVATEPLLAPTESLAVDGISEIQTDDADTGAVTA